MGVADALALAGTAEDLEEKADVLEQHPRDVFGCQQDQPEGERGHEANQSPDEPFTVLLLSRWLSSTGRQSKISRHFHLLQ